MNPYSTETKQVPTQIYPPPPMILVTPQPAATGAWTSGLFDCTQDCDSCCVTCVLPCLTFGRNVEIMERGNTRWYVASLTYFLLSTFIGFVNCYARPYRTRLRGMYNLPAEPCCDCLVYYCCSTCALCQEYRELKNRGLDPSLGWAGNMHRMNQATVAPNYATPMTR